MAIARREQKRRTCSMLRNCWLLLVNWCRNSSKAFDRGHLFRQLVRLYSWSGLPVSDQRARVFCNTLPPLRRAASD